MSDVKAAAERLRRNIYNDNTIFCGDDHTKERDHDRIVLADAYLREHPADDDQEIDYEWLLTIGEHRPNCNVRIGTHGKRILLESRGRLNPPEQWTWHYRGHRIKTRGQLRRLLSALGIEVTK